MISIWHLHLRVLAVSCAKERRNVICTTIYMHSKPHPHNETWSEVVKWKMKDNTPTAVCVRHTLEETDEQDARKFIPLKYNSWRIKVKEIGTNVRKTFSGLQCSEHNYYEVESSTWKIKWESFRENRKENEEKRCLVSHVVHMYVSNEWTYAQIWCFL